jgi:hypothetical protein
MFKNENVYIYYNDIVDIVITLEHSFTNPIINNYQTFVNDNGLKSS